MLKCKDSHYKSQRDVGTVLKSNRHKTNISKSTHISQ